MIRMIRARAGGLVVSEIRNIGIGRIVLGSDYPQFSLAQRVKWNCVTGVDEGWELQLLTITKNTSEQCN